MPCAPQLVSSPTGCSPRSAAGVAFSFAAGCDGNSATASASSKDAAPASALADAQVPA
jgi:hypothetical protein